MMLVLKLNAVVGFICAVVLLSNGCSVMACGEADKRALLSFRAGVVVREHIALADSGLSSWESSSNCCEWRGVECAGGRGAAASARVVGLSLTGAGIAGSLANISVVRSLAQLTALHTLDLSNNSFTGAVTSCLHELSTSCPNMTFLSLSTNLLTGSLPPSLASMSNLRFLDVASQQSHGAGLSGPLPHELCNLSALYFLDLSLNNFSGSIPACLGTLPSLEYLSLFRNHLSGSSIPVQFANLSATLRYLDLGFNALPGSLPSWLCNLTRLSMLGIGGTGQTGTIPSCLGGLGKMRQMFLTSNRLRGSIPEALGNLTSLFQLQVDDNQLTGELPPMFGMLNRLRVLSTGGNFFSGFLPSSLSNCTRLLLLDVSKNEHSGSLPLWLTSHESLRVLILGFNKFKGSIPPQIMAMTHLQVLDLSNNELTGPMPTPQQGFMASGPSDSSTILDIGIVITGKTYALHYGYLQSVLSSLDLSRNSLVGHLPSAMGAMDGLIFLNLSRNRFTGSIPDALGGLLHLESLDLGHNFLSKGIPSSFSALTSLAYLSLAYNNLSGAIPKGRQLNTFPPTSYAGNPNLCGFPLVRACHNGAPPMGLSPINDTHAQKESFIQRWGWMIIRFSIGYAVGFASVALVLWFWRPPFLVALSKKVTALFL